MMKFFFTQLAQMLKQIWKRLKYEQKKSQVQHM